MDVRKGSSLSLENQGKLSEEVGVKFSSEKLAGAHRETKGKEDEMGAGAGRSVPSERRWGRLENRYACQGSQSGRREEPWDAWLHRSGSAPR